MERKKAFTLAEILITLAIIGVVAAMTIPSLMQKTQNQEFVTALKKFYSEANQALLQTAIDNCGTPENIGCFNSSADMQTAIASHFQKSKDCGFSTTNNCMTIFKNYYDGTGNSVNQNTSTDYKFISADGMSIRLGITYIDCAEHSNSDPNSPMYKYCGALYVDVNGSKQPNVMGRDVYAFFITSNKSPLLYPDGGKEFAYNYWKTIHKCQESDKDGRYCAGRIMEEGWEMNY